jgi:hypothetical protein
VIGVGFEIHNTTAELYRQGSLTVAQLADNAEDIRSVMFVDTNIAPTKDNFMQADQACVRASDVGKLLAVPGSQTWPAAEGCYVVPRMIEMPTRLSTLGRITGRVPIVYDSDNHTATAHPSIMVAAEGYTTPAMYNCIPSGFAPVQVFLTGLSTQTTLTITFRTIVEYFPALPSSLLPMSEPSPVYDPMVFGAYSAIIKDAPYAVPVHQNAGGDYFKKILKIVSQALEFGSPMFGQYAPLVALAAKGGRMLLDRKVDKRAAGSSAMQTQSRNSAPARKPPQPRRR